MEYLHAAVRIFPEASKNDTMRHELAQLGGAAELLAIGTVHNGADDNASGTAVIIEDA